eukprot:TRINITY_DN285_c0_g3_i2.p1 TRINITY_DN285_c0_g3~~TRINITY_DN285_c0_g3_i2.p1  ORF type:complete len:246 (+),score=40.36 TRINITY_DN285_c0_g3_i2:281-1018(+)
MKTCISDDSALAGALAGSHAAFIIQKAIETHGHANIILATGVSQYPILDALTSSKHIDWSKVTCFHLDEYIGLSGGHPGSFRRYLKERFADKVHIPPKEFHFIDGELDPDMVVEQLGNLLSKTRVDLCLLGVGVNGHLAFNDPPADFDTQDSYVIVTLDQQCREQQLGEGWFPKLGDVPTQAISMSISQILKSENIICICTGERKAPVVAKLTQATSPDPNIPVTALLPHERCTMFLDKAATADL